MPDEISAEERERRRVLAERLGTAPGAPGFHIGTGLTASTPGMRVADAKGRVARERQDAEAARRHALAVKIGTAPGAPGFHEGSAHNPSTPGYGRGPVRWK